jgi:hypothetical protein
MKTVMEELNQEFDRTTGPNLELAVIDAQNAVQIFTGGGLDGVLDGIEAKVRAIPLDPSTAPGREQIRSVAYKVIRTKTTLDSEGKKLTEGWREATKKVNDERKRSLERLDALAEEVRKPLTDFENKEKARVAAHEAALLDFTSMRDHIAGSPDLTVERLKVYESDISAAHPGRNWEEFSTRAGSLRGELLATLVARIAAREKYDAEQAELSRLRQEEADRIQRERDERLKSEAAEKARLEAERKAKEAADAEAKRVIEAAEAERKRVEAETERVRIENERIRLESENARRREENEKIAALKRATDAEAARVAAEARAERERIEAAERAARQLKEAEERSKREADAAANRERERIEKERKAEEDARAKREANAKLRAKIRAEIVEDLTEKSANEIADALMAGAVRHVRVEF